MQGFIETKSLIDGRTMILSTAQIRTVIEQDYGAFIETDIDGKGRPVGIPVAESYEQIKQKIQNLR